MADHGETLPRSLTAGEPYDPRPGHRPWEVGDEYDRWHGYILCEDPYDSTEVLRNLVGAWDNTTLGHLDYAYSEAALGDLTPPADGRFDSDHLKSIHRTLFQDVYPWAGEPRTVTLVKGAEFIRADHIQPSLDMVSQQLADLDYLQGMNPEQFVDNLGNVHTMVNLCHPFREGNGRTQEVFWSQLAEQAGYTIDWSAIARDPDRYFAACEAAAANSYDAPIKTLLAEATHPLPRGGSQPVSQPEQTRDRAHAHQQPAERPWDEIIPGLWQGSAERAPAASDRFGLVVTMCDQTARWVPAPDSAREVTWPIEDGPCPDPNELSAIARQVNTAIDNGQTVLVRCAAGYNRSGLVAGAALMQRGWTADQAIDRIRDARGPEALDNPAFTTHLSSRVPHPLPAEAQRAARLARIAQPDAPPTRGAGGPTPTPRSPTRARNPTRGIER